MNNVYVYLDIFNNDIKLEILDYNEFRKRKREIKLNFILELRKKYTLSYILEHFDFTSITSIKYYTIIKLLTITGDFYYKFKTYNLLNDEIYELILRTIVTPIIQNKVNQFNLLEGSCIYALKLQNNFFYIGFSNEIVFRLTTHILRLNGTSRLIKYYYVKEIMEIKNGNELDEDNLTQIYKLKYGNDRAEGGKWCSMQDYKDRYGVNKKNIVYIDIL